MSAHLGIYAPRGGAMLTDDTGRLTKLTVSTGAHGYDSCQISAPMPAEDAFRRYDWVGVPNALVRADGTVAFDGRIEDTAIRSTGVDMTAFGYSRALSDSPYTALWSMSDVTRFRPTRVDEQGNRNTEVYTFDTNNRVLIALTTNATYGNVTDIGGMIYQKPEGGSRQIIGAMFDVVVTLPTDWIFQLNQWAANFAAVNTTLIHTGTGGVTPMNRFYTFAACDYIEFVVYNNTGGNYVNADTTGRYKVFITNIRLVTATTNKVDTTTTAGVLAGANINVPVVTSARMYIGQRLHLGIPAANGFPATVKSIPDSTHFVADLTAALAGGSNVQAFVIYADEIVRDLVSTVSTLNSAQLSSSSSQVQSPALDLLSESYEDQYPSAILNRLIALGDNQTTPRQWEWGVYDDQQLYFRPEGSAARVWYVDISTLEVQRTIDALYNSAYAVYQEAAGRTLRGSVATSATSVTRYAVTRRQAVNVSTTSLTQANVQRDASLDDTDDPPPRFGITFDKIFTSAGAPAPIWLPRAGDTIVIRNLPPTTSVSIDQLRTFRIARTSCDLIARTLTVEPETPLPSLASMLALAVPPAWVTAPWWQQIGK